MNQQNFVLVTFTDDRRGRQRLAYAKEFAAAAKAVLSVIVPVSEVEASKMPPMRARIPFEAFTQTLTPAGILEFRQALTDQGSVLAVTDGKEPYFDGLLCLNPVDEDVVFRSGKREAMVPFGVGRAGVRALKGFLPWAKALETSIKLYHTTWEDSDLPEDAPVERHMCEEALATQATMLSACEGHGVAATSLIETAEAVDAGIHLAALMNGANFVVMARGHGAVKGSYVDTFAERSVVPYLIVPESARTEVTP